MVSISVIVPTFNSERFIAAALDSIYRQTSSVDEIICVDDASTDKTVEIVKELYPDVKILANSVNQGPAYSRNKGITAARGNHIAFLDADDQWTDDKIEKQLISLKSDNSIDISAGMTVNFAENDDIPAKPYFNAYLSCLLVKREVFEKTGLLDEAMRLSEDQDWFMKAREAGVNIHILDEVLLLKREHGSNTTAGLTFVQSGMIDAIKKSLDRRRQGNSLSNVTKLKTERLRISVIIPAYNAEAFLGEAIESVLNQTYPVEELIVVDDGSTDDTAKVANSFSKVRYVFQSNQGTAAAVNTGITHSKGDFIAFLDADDLWENDKIRKQVNVFKDNPETDIVFTKIENFFSPSLDTSLRDRIDLNAAPMAGIQKSTLIITRTALDKVGEFSVASSIDLLDWYARVKEHNLREHIIDETLVKRRIHGMNQTLVKKEFKNEFPSVLKNILDRRRANQ